jgi:hypothetical protein
MKRKSTSLARALFESSRSLENLSVSFLIDAKDFFGIFWPSRPDAPDVVPWNNLRTLALTSSLLNPGPDSTKINKLLIAASRAAAYMPRLKVMEIWNGNDGYACVFRYRNHRRLPQITWECSWKTPPQMDDEVISCWSAAMTKLHPNSRLIATSDRFPKKLIKTYAATLRYLQLRTYVLHIISDYQLHWEEYALKTKPIQRIFD